MRDIVEGIVAARRAITSTGRDTLPSDRRHEDLLGLLLAARDSPVNGDAGDALSDAEIADQVLVFLLAGHETTATTVACALVELARHPEWQEVVHHEVDRVVGERQVTGADAPALVWTDRVARETLRLYPAAHSVSRLAPNGDVILGHRIPPGADVLVSPWVTQRSPLLWPSPERFDPARFECPLPGGHRFAWFPFGAGPHACIGAQLAMLEATLVLATLLRAYRLGTEIERIPLAAGITLRPAARLPLTLTARG
jgi:cytochrome P450